MHELTRHGLPQHRGVLDQCADGAAILGEPVFKATELRSNRPLPQTLARKCSNTSAPKEARHTHFKLRGATKDGRRATAVSAIYSEGLCKALLQHFAGGAVTHSPTQGAPSGGSVHLNLEALQCEEGSLNNPARSRTTTSRRSSSRNGCSSCGPTPRTKAPWTHGE